MFSNLQQMGLKSHVFFMLIGIGFLLSESCAVTHINNTLVIGNWKKEQTGYFKGKNSNVDSIFSRESMTELKMQYKNSGQVETPGLKGMIYSGMTFTESKTVTLFIGTKEIHGTWKMNFKGNKIVFNDTATSEKYTIYISSIDSTELKTSQSVIGGTLQQVYRKQK